MNFLIFAGFERIIDIPANWRETSQYVATLAHKVIFMIVNERNFCERIKFFVNDRCRSEKNERWTNDLDRSEK